MNDGRGLAVTAASPGAVEACDAFREALLSIGPGIVDVLAAADAHPGTPLLEACAAALGVLGQTAEGDALAARHLARAAPLVESANDRERAFLEAVRALAARRHEAAARRLEALLEQHPRDLVAAKLLEFDYYLMGQQHSGPRFLATMERIAGENRDEPLFASMHAFALELTGRYDEAIAVAGAACEARPTNPWADHAHAHALHKSGRTREGIAACEARRPLWADRAPFVRGHNTWHLALLHLETLDRGAARALLEEAILPADETPLLVQALDGISLLWRIEMAGGDVEDAAWARMADLSEAEAGSAYSAFQSAHLHFALARAGRDRAQADARARLAAEVAGLEAPERAVWERVGLPLVDAVAAFARGDDRAAAAALAPILADVAAVGGSDAQVDLFRQTAMLACARAGERAAAAATLDGLVAGHAPSPLQESWRALIA